MNKIALSLVALAALSTAPFAAAEGRSDNDEYKNIASKFPTSQADFVTASPLEVVTEPTMHRSIGGNENSLSRR